MTRIDNSTIKSFVNFSIHTPATINSASPIMNGNSRFYCELFPLAAGNKVDVNGPYVDTVNHVPS